ASAASPWIRRRAPAARATGNSRRARRACSSSGKSFSRRLSQRQPAATAADTISDSGRRACRRAVTTGRGGSGIRRGRSVAIATSQSEHVFEEPLGRKLGFFVGALFGRVFRGREAVLGAAVKIELPTHIGSAQLVDERHHFAHRRDWIFGAVQDQDAAADLLRRLRSKTAKGTVDRHGAKKRHAGLGKLDRYRAAEAIADNGDLAGLNQRIGFERFEAGQGS